MQFANRNLANINSFEVACKDTKSHIFKPENTHRPFEIILMTDQQKLQGELYKGRGNVHPTLLQFKHKNKLVSLPTLLERRGNSRRLMCEYKPLKMSFLDDKIQAATEPMDLNVNSKEYQQKYYQNLRTLYFKNNSKNATVDFKSTKQKDLPFKKLGKKMKIVSHCGESNWSSGVKNAKQHQEQSLLQEYYLYKIQELLYPMTLRTQLIRIKYIDKNGSLKETALGFFRERVQRVIKRCGFKKLEDNPLQYSTNIMSAYQALFTSFLFQNYDFEYKNSGQTGELVSGLNENGEKVQRPNFFTAHNIETFLSNDDEVYTVPYDFDLSALIQEGAVFPYYYENATGEANSLGQITVNMVNALEYLQNWITDGTLDNFTWESQLDSDLNVRAQRGIANIENFLNKSDRIKQLIEDSLLSKNNKDKFLRWLEVNSKGLQKTLEEIQKK